MAAAARVGRTTPCCTIHMMIDVVSAYQKAKKRLFLLDYDGTLVGFEPLPELAKPSPDLLSLLKKLTDDPHNTVAIVSGRSHQPFDSWFDELPLTVFAEHGAMLKQPGQEWEILLRQGDDWNTPVQKLMQKAVDHVAGSFIEEKTIGHVWHYRAAPDQALAESTAAQLKNDLTSVAAQHDLLITASKRMVEVRLKSAHKGTAVIHALDKSYDFILAAGDDLTDEDIFAALPPSAFTIKIGPDATIAKHRLPSYEAFLDLLKNLG